MDIFTKYDDDCIDRLNYVYTSLLLLVIIMFIGQRQFVGEPIHCLMSDESRNLWEKSTETYCYIDGTYKFVGSEFPSKDEAPKLKYCNWVPIYLLFIQLVGFLGPIILKKLFMSANIKNLFRNIKNRKTGDNQFSNLQGSNRFTIIYLIYKITNLSNSFIQIFFMNRFFNIPYNFWGFEIITDVIQTGEWRISESFSRTTYCDFIQHDEASSKPMTFTVQCVLPINAYNEKVFIFLWLWYAMVIILNFLDVIYWLYFCFSPVYGKRRFIKTMLVERKQSFSDADIDGMIESTISMDGITVLKLIDINSDNHVASFFLEHLYEKYKIQLHEMVKKLFC